MIAVSILFLALFSLRDKAKVFLVLIITVVLAISANRALIAVTHAGSAPTRAVFSVFFQQTARYMLLYPEDVTSEQYEAIDAVLSADTIGEKYAPLLSDPVKNTYKTKATSAELAKYFKAWFEMFLRHPKVYLDSFLQFAYGYLEPFNRPSVMSDFLDYMAGTAKDDHFNIHYLQSKTVRKWFSRMAREDYLSMPVISWIAAPGTYLWICIGCFLLLSKKGCLRQLIVFSLPAMRYLICIASPISGSIRYAAPQMAIAPLLIAFTYASVCKRASEADALSDASKQQPSAAI